MTWKEFEAKFCEFGGDGAYAAWSVVYLEPPMADQIFYGKGCPHRCPLYEGKAEWGPGLCPSAEKIQPQLMQFKNNIGGRSIRGERMDKHVGHALTAAC